MNVVREAKRQARRDLHTHLAVSALYILGSDAPLPVTVRLQIQSQPLGDLKGTSFHYAERDESSPTAIFMRSELADPKRGAIISVAVGEAYRIDTVLQPYDITIAAHIVPLSPAQASAYPVP